MVSERWLNFYLCIPGIHLNVGPKGFCNTPLSECAALCDSYNSSVVSHAELQAAYLDGWDCRICGWTTDGSRYYFCHRFGGYCTDDSLTGILCMSCGNVYCQHNDGKSLGHISVPFCCNTAKCNKILDIGLQRGIVDGYNLSSVRLWYDSSSPWCLSNAMLSMSLANPFSFLMIRKYLYIILISI